MTNVRVVASVGDMSKPWGMGRKKANIVRTGSAWTNAKHEAVAIYLRGSVAAAWMSPRKWALVDAISAGPRAMAAELAAALPPVRADETASFIAGLRQVALDTLPSYPTYYLLEPGGSTPAYHAAAVGNGHLLDGPAALGQLVAASWTERRAMMFLDPLAFAIGWQTIAAIAATRAVADD